MTAAIEVRGLGKRRGARWVVDEVSFAIAPGEIAALVGGNGAGKSTTLAMIAGALSIDRGWVAIAGATSGRRRQLGYVPESAAPQPADQRPQLDAMADRRFAQMSLGQRRRACLAAALIGAPPALVLDEPDNGLDVDALDALATLVRAAAAAGAGVIIASHDPAVQAELATRTLRLVDGRLAT